MTIDIHLNFYDNDDHLIGHKEKKYSGDSPVAYGYKWCKDIFESYATDINRVEVEIYEDGIPVSLNEYKVETFLRDDLYCNLKRIIDSYDSSDGNIGLSTVLTNVKHELKRYAKDRKYLQKDESKK